MTFDTIVIGAGAMGSATSYFTSKKSKTLLLDQFDFLHNKGSSHGKSRIIRKTYQEKHFADMMNEAYSLWDLIQKEANTNVHTNTGGLNIGHKDDINLQNTLKTCESMNLEHEVFMDEKIKSRFPAYKTHEELMAVYQKETGILNATKSLKVLQKLSRKNGAKLLDNHKITDINYSGELIEVKTDSKTFKTKKLVISPGSWINNLLKLVNLQVDVEIWKQTIAYWPVKSKYVSNFNSEKFPPFIYWAENDNNYGFPIHERDNYVKIAAHQNDIIPKIRTHDDINDPNENLLAHIATFISSSMIGIDTNPKFIETCYYSCTRDENFIIDYHPDNSNIVIAGGFSGHGFKFTPLIGKIVSEMLNNQEPGYEMTHFKLSNFTI